MQACPDTAASAQPCKHPLTAPFRCAAACSNGNYLTTVGANKVCAACVSKSSTKAYNAPRKCYRSVSVNGGTSCGAHHRSTFAKDPT